MAAADVVRAFVDGSLTATDDAGTPHSGTLGGMTGTYSVSGIKPNGREVIVAQSQGAVFGVRQGARAFPTITIEAHAVRFDSDFDKLVRGTTSGFVSVMADIGDAVAVNLDLSEDYSTDTRGVLAEDCVLDTMAPSMSDGESGKVQYTFIVHGKLTIDGDVVIAGR